MKRFAPPYVCGEGSPRVTVRLPPTLSQSSLAEIRAPGDHFTRGARFPAHRRASARCGRLSASEKLQDEPPARSEAFPKHFSLAQIL